MKSKLTNVAQIVGIFLIVATMVVGCSNTEDELEDISLTNESTPVELIFYMTGEKSENTDEFLDQVAEASNLNIRVNFKCFNRKEYHKTIDTAIASNEKFDAFLCGRPIPGRDNYINMFRNGQIKDITDLLPEYAPIIYSQLSKAELDSARVDGKVVIVPPKLPMVDTIGVYVKKDIADKYKISSINSFEDYGELLKKIKDNEKDIIPCQFRGGYGIRDIDLYVGEYGYVVLDYEQHLVYKWDDPKMKIIPWEQSEGFKETTDLICNWDKGGYIEKDYKSKKVATIISRFGEITEGTYEKNFFNDGNKEAFNYYILNKDKKIQRRSPSGAGPYTSIAFNSNSQNTERALMLLNWIQSNQENYDLFNYGMKNKDYILKDERIEILKSKEGPNYIWYNIPFLNINYIRLSVGDELPDSYKQDFIEYIETSSEYAPHEGFYPNYKDIQLECNRRIELYDKKISTAIQIGTYDINETDNIIDELEKVGTEMIVSEIQRQLDEWRVINKK